jgi:type IV pilus assembly protein PilO
MTFEDLQNLQPEDLKKIGAAPVPVKLLAVAIICVVVAVLGYFVLVVDHVEKLKTTQQKEVTLKQEFERKQSKTSNLTAYEDQLKEMEVTFGSMLKSLPDKAEVESLLVEISRAGSANNLKINIFSPAGESPKEFYAEYPIKMNVEGSYGELTGFVSNVSALQRIVTLHDIKIEPLTDSDDASVTFTAKTYRYISNEDE